MFTSEQIATNYQINFSKLIGKGQDSTVFFIINKQTKQQCALKCLTQTIEQNAINLFIIFISYFQENKIQILRHIQNPHIITMIRYYSDCSCMLFELMSNDSLYKILLQDPLPVAIANRISQPNQLKLFNNIFIIKEQLIEISNQIICQFSEIIYLNFVILDLLKSMDKLQYPKIHFLVVKVIQLLKFGKLHQI